MRKFVILNGSKRLFAAGIAQRYGASLRTYTAYNRYWKFFSENEHKIQKTYDVVGVKMSEF
jgi:hypothetical protein